MALFSLLIACSACLDTNEDEMGNTQPRIKKKYLYVGYKLFSQASFAYDGAGRLSRYNDENSSFEYIYKPEMVIIKGRYSGLDINDTLPLNDKGLYTEPPSFNIEYDAQGYCVSKTALHGNIAVLNTYQVENGNTVHWTKRTGKEYETITDEEAYTFLPHSTNTIGNENMGVTYHGKQDKNLMASRSSIYRSTDGVETYPTNYEYRYDERGRVAKQIVTGERGNYTLFTYYD